jgi:hypothetical protein
MKVKQPPIYQFPTLAPIGTNNPIFMRASKSQWKQQEWKYNDWKAVTDVRERIT